VVALFVNIELEGLMQLFQIREGNPNTCHAIPRDQMLTVRNETG